MAEGALATPMELHPRARHLRRAGKPGGGCLNDGPRCRGGMAAPARYANGEGGRSGTGAGCPGMWIEKLVPERHADARSGCTHTLYSACQLWAVNPGVRGPNIKVL